MSNSWRRLSKGPIVTFDEYRSRSPRCLHASLEQKAVLLLAMTDAVQSSAKAVGLMYHMAGTIGFYTRSPLDRLFRDAQVLNQRTGAGHEQSQ
jgi:hypothetical protein